jgi:hypothetical protein
MTENAAPATETPAAEPDTTWVDRYRRRVLDFVDASKDVDLASVRITSGFEEAYQYSEYTGGGGFFAIDVTWFETTPSASYDRVNADGLYQRSRQLTNDEVAEFLNTLDSP